MLIYLCLTVAKVARNSFGGHFYSDVLDLSLIEPRPSRDFVSTFFFLVSNPFLLEIATMFSVPCNGTLTNKPEILPLDRTLAFHD